MSEGVKPQSIDERVAQLDENLDRFEKSLGLPSHTNYHENHPIHGVLQMSHERLQKLTASECDEFAFLLNQFGLHIQRAHNSLRSKVVWAEESLKKSISGTISNQKGYSWDERKMNAVRGNDAAQKYEHVRVASQLKIERLAYISMKVERMAKSLENLSFAKRGKHDD